MTRFCIPPPLAVALVALLLGACASKPQRPRDTQPLTIDIAFAEAPGNFRFVYRHEYDTLEAGDQIRFVSTTHPELTSDVFVYVPGIWPDYDSAADALATDTEASLEQAVADGLFTDLEVLSASSYLVTTYYGQNRGRHLRISMRKDGQEMISHAHLFYLPPYSIKFRSTFPSYGNTSFDDEIDALVQGFMSDVRIGKAVRCRKNTNWYVTADGTSPWVSVDGLDVVGPLVDESEADAIVSLVDERQRNNFCSRD